MAEISVPALLLVPISGLLLASVSAVDSAASSLAAERLAGYTSLSENLAAAADTEYLGLHRASIARYAVVRAVYPLIDGVAHALRMAMAISAYMLLLRLHTRTRYPLVADYRTSDSFERDKVHSAGTHRFLSCLSFLPDTGNRCCVPLGCRHPARADFSPLPGRPHAYGKNGLLDVGAICQKVDSSGSKAK